MMTFEDICGVEPALAALADEINDLHFFNGRPSEAEAIKLWYGARGNHDRSYHQRMTDYVGYKAANPHLRRREAYEVACRALWCLLSGDAYQVTVSS